MYDRVGGASEMDFNFNFNTLILITSQNVGPFLSSSIYRVDPSWLSIDEAGR